MKISAIFERLQFRAKRFKFELTKFSYEFKIQTLHKKIFDENLKIFGKKIRLEDSEKISSSENPTMEFFHYFEPDFLSKNFQQKTTFFKKPSSIHQK